MGQIIFHALPIMKYRESHNVNAMLHRLGELLKSKIYLI